MDIQKSQWAQEFAEQQRQLNEQMAMQRSYGGGGYGGYGGYGGGYSSAMPTGYEGLYDVIAKNIGSIYNQTSNEMAAMGQFLPSTAYGTIFGGGQGVQLPQVSAQQMQQAAGGVPWYQGNPQQQQIIQSIVDQLKRTSGSQYPSQGAMY